MFSDPHYNRTSFVIAGVEPAAVAATAQALAAAALAALPPLTAHDATHPRIGVVDHIAVAPLFLKDPASSDEALRHDDGVRGDDSEGANAGTNLADAAVAASILAAALASDLGLPVMLYGAARAHAGLEPRTLAETRRQTPYFRAKAKNSGLISSDNDAAGDKEDLWAGVTPDLGGPLIDPAVGVCCVGATPLVLNFNVRLTTTDRKVAAACAAAVRTRTSSTGSLRDAGLPWVEALPLVHANGRFEVACNLLRPLVTPPASVLAAIEASLARQACGVAVEEAYTIGMAVEEICAKLLEDAP
jgi:glutamate formiminotransferase